jgi:hypothetical protein
VFPGSEFAVSHLILTTNELAADRLRRTDLANVVISFDQRFVYGKLPSQDELAILLGPRWARCDVGVGHWLHGVRCGDREGDGNRDTRFVDFCDKFDAIELWADPQPNDQLVLLATRRTPSPQGNHIEAELCSN